MCSITPPSFVKNADGTPDLSKATTTVVDGQKRIIMQMAQIVNVNGTQKVVHPRLYYHADGNSIDRLKTRAFLMPGADIKPENLTVYVETSLGYYQLDGKSHLSNSNFTSGLIHRLKLPKFDEESRHEFDYSHWMDQIDPTVYATELSLPGSWESFNTAYQPDPTDLGGLQNYQYQYQKGIRAFTVKPADVVNTGTNRNPVYSDIVIESANSTQLSSVLSYFQTQLAKNKDEYVVLIVRGLDKNANYIPALRALCSTYNTVVYQDSITPQTTVGQLRGKVVIKGNIDGDGAVTKNIPMLFSKWSQGSRDQALEAPLYWGTWPGKTPDGKEGNTKLIWCYTEVEEVWEDSDASQAGIWGATKSERRQAVDSYIAQSLAEYNRKKHDTWMFLLVGGFKCSNVNGAKTTPTVETTGDLSQYLNGYTYEKLSDPNRKPCPIGLVMMNQVNNNTYQSQDLIRTIINNNNAFIMQKAGAAQSDNDANLSNGGSLGN